MGQRERRDDNPPAADLPLGQELARVRHELAVAVKFQLHPFGRFCIQNAQRQVLPGMPWQREVRVDLVQALLRQRFGLVADRRQIRREKTRLERFERPRPADNQLPAPVQPIDQRRLADRARASRGRCRPRSHTPRRSTSAGSTAAAHICRPVAAPRDSADSTSRPNRRAAAARCRASSNVHRPRAAARDPPGNTDSRPSSSSR